MNLKPKCNLCGGTTFEEYRGRPNERCRDCGSKARHRVAWHVYQQHMNFDAQDFGRVLHLAPEAGLHQLLEPRLASSYLTADPRPEKYPHAQCLKLFFPEGYEVFPQGYFSVILHNHVMEHIPGHYKDHLAGFRRLLKTGGKMIFSIPGPYKHTKTIEGGEYLDTDQERLEQFLQEDHFKIFGTEFESVLAALPGFRLVPDGITNEMRAALSVRPNKAPMFILEAV